MRPISAIGKFLDQPLLTAKINKHLPVVLGTGAGIFLASEINKAPQEDKKKTGKKSAIILATTVLSALLAPKISSAITHRKPLMKINEVKTRNKEIADKYICEHRDTEIKTILEKSKDKLLSLKEISKLFNKDKNMANELIPPPENIQAKDIFREIGYLSIYGAVPVVGGIAGGIAADRVTETNWKEGIPNKIKEGVYQYLANIFLCNIGAGAALGVLEKLGIKSKAARCLGMTTGIILTGIIGGSFIANFIGNKLINPLISKNCPPEERKPELIDISLHTDDIATVSLLSGLKWIEPALPILYSVSGYRAGIGYRNNKQN